MCVVIIDHISLIGLNEVALKNAVRNRGLRMMSVALGWSQVRSLKCCWEVESRVEDTMGE